MENFISSDFGNPSSQHLLGRRAAEGLTRARDGVAELFSARAEQIFFTSGGTESCNIAVKGAILKGLKEGRRRAVISAIEHPAVYEAAMDMRSLGCDVCEIEPDERGKIDEKAVGRALDGDVSLCAVMHVNNETGVIQPVEKIYALCREVGAFFFCDCVQSAGALPFPQADGIAISAHKFYGPKGAGALYLKNSGDISRVISGGGQERGLRSGTQNVAAAVGLEFALRRAFNCADEVNKRLSRLRQRLFDGVKELGGVDINGEDCLPRILNLSFKGCAGENLVMYLDLHGVCASAGAACSAGAAKPSRTVLKSWGEERAKSAVRFSFGKYNAEEEIDLAAAYLREAVSKMRAKTP